ncbi:PREDICTED: F-box protein At1g10780-like [Camelina sativa]|uniref:F-box protein At1g10780-like n=1 Tax=Camelina sativa TaxID=90675 RepID=A0ABM0VMI2_CAMSA|nr:PREDICTED: F-box protein At1g10780-like [Camelina sativa]
MDSLPDALLQYILSNMTAAKDVAACNCVSNRWKESTDSVQKITFLRNSFDSIISKTDDDDDDTISKTVESDTIVRKMISSFRRLEELVVYSPFSSCGLASWMTQVGSSLKLLELRMDNLASEDAIVEGPLKLDCVGVAKNLETLRLWGVLMMSPPKWDMFPNLRCLEIVGARTDDATLCHALRACPNLSNLLLLACEGVKSISIDLPYLEHCKLDFYGPGNSVLVLTSPRLLPLDVQGCSFIRVPETRFLKTLSISNIAGRVYMVDFHNLSSLEDLSIRGIQWCWDALCIMLQQARDVKRLFMKVEFTGNESLQPFPEIDFVEFFNNHPKLQTFDIHGAMFAALCQKNSLKKLETGFAIPCLEEVTITVRSPLNAEQKMNTLESLVRYARVLKRMVIRILRMKSNHSSADDFCDDICKFRYMHQHLVKIE